MNIRTLVDLQARLDEGLAHRKRELTTTKFLCSERLRPHEQNVIRRSSVCLAYAHWEGFVRDATQAYLCYVARQGLSIRNAAPQTMALHLRTKLRQSEISNKLSLHTDIILNVLSGDQPVNIPWESALKGVGNLNSEALSEVLCTVGIDESWYATKSKWIDIRLVKSRNEVAHGELIPVSEDDYVEISQTVIELMNRFGTDVQNAAVSGAFRR